MTTYERMPPTPSGAKYTDLRLGAIMLRKASWGEPKKQWLFFLLGINHCEPRLGVPQIINYTWLITNWDDTGLQRSNVVIERLPRHSSLNTGYWTVLVPE